MASRYRELLLSELAATPLPGLPTANGEGVAFKEAVRRAIHDMIARRPTFATVYVPLKISFFVVLPLSLKKGPG
jgi:hypothetical protein